MGNDFKSGLSDPRIPAERAMHNTTNIAPDMRGTLGSNPMGGESSNYTDSCFMGAVMAARANDLLSKQEPGTLGNKPMFQPDTDMRQSILPTPPLYGRAMGSSKAAPCAGDAPGGGLGTGSTAQFQKS